MKRNQKGQSLVELVIIVGILVFMIYGTFFVFQAERRKIRDQAVVQNFSGHYLFAEPEDLSFWGMSSERSEKLVERYLNISDYSEATVRSIGQHFNEEKIFQNTNTNSSLPYFESFKQKKSIDLETKTDLYGFQSALEVKDADLILPHGDPLSELKVLQKSTGTYRGLLPQMYEDPKRKKLASASNYEFYSSIPFAIPVSFYKNGEAKPVSGTYPSVGSLCSHKNKNLTSFNFGGLWGSSSQTGVKKGRGRIGGNWTNGFLLGYPYEERQQFILAIGDKKYSASENLCIVEIAAACALDCAGTGAGFAACEAWCIFKKKVKSDCPIFREADNLLCMSVIGATTAYGKSVEIKEKSDVLQIQP